jgi:hypothetical protein
MFAGSVLDLEPDTAYEVQLVLSDPDGVEAEARRVVTVRTRAEPVAYEGGRTFHVYPHGFAGPKTEPAFEGLMCAYNYWCAGTDWATAGRPRVRPGDTMLVHAGVYQYNCYEYTNNPAVNRTVPLEGTYYLTADGTPDMPIAIKAAGDGEVVFDGSGNFALFDVRAADYTYFEGITFRNAEIAILHGDERLALVLGDVVDGADGGMVEGGGGPRLPPEALDRASVARDLAREELEGDLAAEGAVLGAIDHPHPAGADERVEAIATDRGPRVHRGRRVPRRLSPRGWPPSVRARGGGGTAGSRSKTPCE